MATGRPLKSWDYLRDQPLEATKAQMEARAECVDETEWTFADLYPPEEAIETIPQPLFIAAIQRIVFGGCTTADLDLQARYCAQKVRVLR